MVGVSKRSACAPLVLLACVFACSTSERLQASNGGGVTGGGPGGLLDGGGTVGTSCTTNAICGSGRICANGACVFDDGDCATNKDCQGDTYCCTGSCLPPGTTQGRSLEDAFFAVAGEGHSATESP